MSRSPRLAPLAVAAVLAVGCGELLPTPTAQSHVPPPTLRVAAASDLQAALPVLAERFQARYRVEVIPTFGASGQLAEQVRQGAPYDVFLAANRSFVEKLADDGSVIKDSVRTYALGTLVLAVHPDAADIVHGLDDLKKPEVKKVALANPAIAPYGAAARQALQRAKLWDDLQPKLVQSESVRQALQFVETGNAEAGFVGKSIARASKTVRIVELDPTLYDPIVQGLGIAAHTKEPTLARQFVDFLTSDEGRSILAEHGFSAPGPDSERKP